MSMDDEAELRRRAEQRADAKIGFRSHLITYVVVNAFLFAIDYFSGDGWWFYWPMLGWGVGLAAHFLSVHLDLAHDRERLVEAEMQRLRRRA